MSTINLLSPFIVGTVSGVACKKVTHWLGYAVINATYGQAALIGSG